MTYPPIAAFRPGRVIPVEPGLPIGPPANGYGRSVLPGPATTGRWVVGFLVTAFCLQVGLFFLGGSALLRLPLRIGVYGISLALLFVLRGRAHAHPAWMWSQAAIAVLFIETLNPAGDRIIARGATVVLYASVLAPLLWVARLSVTVRDFRVILRLMWGFYTASAVMGVLQVNYPGRFDGAMSSAMDEQSLVRYVVQLADGRCIIRPKGLTDTPGGASTAGVNAIVLGTGLLLTETGLALRVVSVAGMVAGLFCIYICQVRVNLVVSGIAMIVLAALLVRRLAVRQAITLLAVGVGVTVVGTAIAFAVGGQTVVDRFTTLVADDAGTVYQTNRGTFLDLLIQNDIYNYPLGAGQGRWGMVNVYFGTPDTALWAEILWQSLLYDGGVLLIGAYIGLFACLVWVAYRLAVSSRSHVIGCWAAVVLSYDIAAIAASFVFPIMIVQLGMEVVLLNACLYGVTRSTIASRRPTPGHGSFASGGGDA